MQRYSKRLLGVSLFLLLVSCGDSPKPPDPPETPEGPEVVDPPEAVGEAVGIACEGHVQPEGAQVRLTLNKEGTILQAEALNHACNWEAPPDQRTDGQPASVGEPVGTITIYALNENATDLVDENGKTKHSHAGGADGSMTSHCHRWYKSGSTWILVHC